MSVSGTASAAGTASARGHLSALLALGSDAQRLDALKAVWPAADKEALVRETTKELEKQASEYSSSTSPLTVASAASLRALLGLVSLLSRREYAPAQTGRTSLPVEVFPGLLGSLLVLLEAPEREVAGSDGADASQRHQVRFHALHAFNRFLEAFPPIAGVFVPTVVEQCAKELFAPSAGAPHPAFGLKLLETLGLILATLPASMVARSHEYLKQALELVASSLDGIEVYTLPVPAAASAGGKALPPSVEPRHTFVLGLLDFASSLVKKLHLRLPVSYPSARFLHPRAWPFGSEELGEEEAAGGGKDDDTEGADGADEDEDKDDAIDEEDEDEDSDAAGGASTSTTVAPKPRQCFTEALEFNPVRRGAQKMDFSPEAASELLATVAQRLRVLHTKIGVEGASSTSVGAVNDHGATILAFLPLVVALDNVYGVHSEGSVKHAALVDDTAAWLIEQLRELDFAARSYSVPLASASHQLLQGLTGVFKYARRDEVEDVTPLIYTDLTNWLADAQAVFPRAAFIKLRRHAVEAFLGVLYAMDTSFQDRIGTAAFFGEVFPLLANPLLTSHLVWFLRTHRAHLVKKVLPQVMRGLLNTKTKGSPSVKTVEMILKSMGNVACFTRAVKEDDEEGEGGEKKDGEAASASSASKPPATLPLLAPYMPALLDTIINTASKSPSGTGQIACLVLCRIVLAGYEMPEVRESLPRILDLYARILTESVFIAEQAEMGEEYDENDQDLVAQLQYCAADMCHVLFQDQAEATTEKEKIARGVPGEGHPFDQPAFVRTVAEDEDSVLAVREIVRMLIENTKKPIFFNDDAALRNSEIHLLKEIVAHTDLLQAMVAAPPDEEDEPEAVEEPAGEAAASDEPKVAPPAPLPPFTVPTMVTTLLQAILLAKEDGQAERKYNYVVCLSGIASAINSVVSLQTSVTSALSDPSQKKLLDEVRRDAETWKVVGQAGWAPAK